MPVFSGVRDAILKCRLMRARFSFLGLVAVGQLMSSSAYGAPRGPLVEPAPNPVECEHGDSDLSGYVELERGCIYEQSFEINEPNTTLDCQGAILRPTDGFAVNIKRDADGALIRNCYMNGQKGIAVRVRKVRDGETDDDVRSLSPTGVVIEHIHVSASEGVGVHLLPHTVGVTVRNSIIINNSSAGVYLSPYGRQHQILNNLIAGNGHRKPDGFPRLGWYRREGIAIDGASENYIADNDINDNAFGGILLYKNCWEHAAEEPNSRPRTDHARANVIENNNFREQPFGVWIAARQSRDLTAMGCGDPTPYRNPIAVQDVFHPSYSSYPSAHTELYFLSLNMASVWPDFAEENQVRNNTFEAIDRGGVRVEDDDAEIVGNLFIGEFDYVFVGAPFRARLANQPVLNTLISRNSFAGTRDMLFTARLALIPDEHEGTIIEDNFRACPSEDGRYARHGQPWEPSTDISTDLHCQEPIVDCVDGTWMQRPLDPDCFNEMATEPTNFEEDETQQPDVVMGPASSSEPESELSPTQPSSPPSVENGGASTALPSDGLEEALPLGSSGPPAQRTGQQESYVDQGVAPESVPDATAPTDGCRMAHGLSPHSAPVFMFVLLLFGCVITRRRQK